MAVNYGSLAATAERLIRENGRDITFIRKSRTPMNPAKPWDGRAGAATPDPEDSRVTVKGVMWPYTEDEMRDENTRRASNRALVSAVAFGAGKTHEDMEYVEDGVTGKWRVVKVEALQPGDTNILFIAQLVR